MNETRKITAAAIKYGSKIWQGKRHTDIMAEMREAKAAGDTSVPDRVSQDMQGFVDNEGNWWTRFQAGAIAFRAGQTKERKQTLLSEHLW